MVMLDQHTTYTSAMALVMVVALLFACGPGDPNERVQPAATTHQGSVTSGPGSLAVSGAPSKQGPSPTVPEWMAQALASPDVQVRLDALETWARRNRRGAVDPLLRALNDPDDRVRKKAVRLIAQDWIVEQATDER